MSIIFLDVSIASETMKGGQSISDEGSRVLRDRLTSERFGGSQSVTMPGSTPRKFIAGVASSGVLGSPTAGVTKKTVATVGALGSVTIGQCRLREKNGFKPMMARKEKNQAILIPGGDCEPVSMANLKGSSEFVKITELKTAEEVNAKLGTEHIQRPLLRKLSSFCFKSFMSNFQSGNDETEENENKDQGMPIDSILDCEEILGKNEDFMEYLKQKEIAKQVKSDPNAGKIFIQHFGSPSNRTRASPLSTKSSLMTYIVPKKS